MPDFAVVTAFKATDKMSPVFNKMGGVADKFGDRASGAFHRASKSGMTFRARMSDIAGGIIGASLVQRGARALWDFGKNAVELASSLNEVQNVVKVTFGDSEKDINNFAKSAIKNFGLSELQAKQFTGSLGAMMKSSGIKGKPLIEMSTGLSALAGDFASFYNLPIEEAFDKIRSGISGETEPLKRIGVNMNVANLEAFALTQGLNKQWKAMTQAEQVALRYNYLMSVTKDAQGDFNRTLKDSYANQKRVFQTMLQQTAARTMSKLLPTLTQGFAKLNEFMGKIDADKLGNGLMKIVNAGIWLVQVLWKLRYVIMAVAGGFAAYKISIFAVMAAQKIMMLAGWIKYIIMMRSVIMKAITMTKAWAVVQKILNVVMSLNPVGLIIIGIAALIAIIIVAIKYYDKFGAALLVILGPIGMIVSAFKKIYDRWDEIKTAFSTEGIIAGFKKLGQVIFDGILYPIQQLYEILGKIPGKLGKSYREDASRIKKFRENYLGADAKAKALSKVQKSDIKNSAGIIDQIINKVSNFNRNITTNNQQSPSGMRAPNEAEIRSRKIDFQGRIDIAGAPEGSKVRSETKGAPALILELLGVNS
jgi:hypothetical protein